MNGILNVIRDNAVVSWIGSILIGFLYYSGYALGRAIVRPLSISWFPKFTIDPVIGPIPERVALFNIFESAIVAIRVGIPLSLLLCYLFQKRATIYGATSIVMFLVMFAVLIGARLSSENDPLLWIRVLKPISAAIVFGVILWLVTKTEVCLTSGSRRA